MTDTSLSSVTLGVDNESKYEYSEPTASWAIKYLDADGFVCILTLSGQSGGDLLQKGQSAIKYLLGSGCLPVNGNNKKGGGNNNKREPTVVVKPAGKGENPFCKIHNVEMTEWRKGDKTWFSHRWNSGFCNGKVNKP